MQFTFIIGLLSGCLAQIQVIGQATNYEGRLLDDENSQAIPYVLIENISQKTGALSNTDGYFQVKAVVGDSLQCLAMGYQLMRWTVDSVDKYKVLRLVPTSVELNEVTVLAKDMGYLADIIAQARKVFKADPRTAKAYFDLKTYYGDQQIELLEAYSNAKQFGPSIESIRYKTGRVALKKFEDRVFASVESSKAIVQINAFEGHEDFPNTPMEMSAKKMRSTFVFRVQRQFKDEKGDSILVIGYRPRVDDGKSCKGRIWLNTTNHTFLKWTMEVENAQEYPFIPLFPTDRVENFYLNITQTFEQKSGLSAIKQVDFVYAMDYYSGNGREEFVRYPIRTRALLYLYDRQDGGFQLSFYPPLYEDYTDYRKMSSIPYNATFWEHHNEYALSDSLKWNAYFFNDTADITSHNLFKGQPFHGRRFYQNNFVEWSPKRVLISDVAEDSIARNAIIGTRSTMYDIAVHVYFDVFNYTDSMQVSSVVMMDPFRTYYYLERDAASDCFINMYFDLCEVLRRQWLRKMHEHSTNEKHYREAFVLFELERLRFLDTFKKDVQRGQNESAMRRYNEIILEELQINNIEIFQLFQNKQ
jgi:hypothetical protein